MLKRLIARKTTSASIQSHDVPATDGLKTVTPSLAKGTRVYCRWPANDMWYWGEIVTAYTVPAKTTGKYHELFSVRFDDGDLRRRVPLRDLVSQEECFFLHGCNSQPGCNGSPDASSNSVHLVEATVTSQSRDCPKKRPPRAYRGCIPLSGKGDSQSTSSEGQSTLEIADSRLAKKVRYDASIPPSVVFKSRRHQKVDRKSAMSSTTSSILSTSPSSAHLVSPSQPVGSHARAGPPP